MVHVTERGLAVYTRTGREVTSSLPELAPILAAVPPGTVLDGELVAESGGASTFYRLGPLLASRPDRRRSTVTFAAFDVLAVAGERVVALPYEERRRRLESIAFGGPTWCTVPSWRGLAAVDVLAVCHQHDVEGVVAKRLSSRYWPGRRRSDWVKLKTTAWKREHAPRRPPRSLQTAGG